VTGYTVTRRPQNRLRRQRQPKFTAFELCAHERRRFHDIRLIEAIMCIHGRDGEHTAIDVRGSKACDVHHQLRTTVWTLTSDKCTTTKAYGQLDFSSTYKVNDHLSVFASATNLTDAIQVWYQVYLNRLDYAEKDGRTFTVGVHGKL
jgi:hypothetical protein